MRLGTRKTHQENLVGLCNSNCLAEFRPQEVGIKFKSEKSGGVYVTFFSSQTGKCANAVSACTRLQSSEKCLYFSERAIALFVCWVFHLFIGESVRLLANLCQIRVVLRVDGHLFLGQPSLHQTTDERGDDGEQWDTDEHPHEAEDAAEEDDGEKDAEGGNAGAVPQDLGAQNIAVKLL